MSYINIAIPKGRMGEKIMEILEKTYTESDYDKSSRKLVFKDHKNKITYMWLKNSDIVTYLENGVTDLAFSGLDMLVEQNANVLELAQLEIGLCKMSIAGYKDTVIDKEGTLKVATKYVNTAKKYFDEKNQKIKLIKLNGSVELAPVLGLSDIIVDIVETGGTLKANGLEVLRDIFDINLRVIGNNLSYSFHKEKIDEIIKILKRGEQYA